MEGVGTPIIGKPQPLPDHDTPNPTPSIMKSRKSKSRQQSDGSRYSFNTWLMSCTQTIAHARVSQQKT